MLRIHLAINGIEDGITKKDVILAILQGVGLEDAIDGWGYDINTENKAVAMDIFVVTAKKVFDSSILQDITKTYNTVKFFYDS